MKALKGFTLIEIFIVLIIIGIIVSVAVPKFKELQEDRQIKEATQQRRENPPETETPDMFEDMSRDVH